jgi:Domain of unknown function (DUF397)
MTRPASVPMTQRQPAWRKSTFCQSGECAEVAADDGEIAIRSTRAPSDVVRFTVAEWQALIAGIKAGEFNPR